MDVCLDDDDAAVHSGTGHHHHVMHHLPTGEDEALAAVVADHVMESIAAATAQTAAMLQGHLADVHEVSDAADSDPTSAMIAQAAAAAVEAAAVDVDVTAAANAAALAVEDAESKAAAAAEQEALAKKNEQRRKRYREKAVDEDTKDGSASSAAKKKPQTHEELLAARRMKDRQRYANMTPDQRRSYNSKRREQYHRQSEISRQKRRERERLRYHALESDDAKTRNARRAKLERERYQKLTPQELEIKNRKRRERAALARQKKGSKVRMTEHSIPMAAAFWKKNATLISQSRSMLIATSVYISVEMNMGLFCRFKCSFTSFSCGVLSLSQAGSTASSIASDSHHGSLTTGAAEHETTEPNAVETPLAQSTATHAITAIVKHEVDELASENAATTNILHPELPSIDSHEEKLVEEQIVVSI